MSLIGKRPTTLLALMLTAAALACAAVLLAGSAPANAAPKEPLVITDVSPDPEETVPGYTGGLVQVTFNQPINVIHENIMRLINVNTGENVPFSSVSWIGTINTLQSQISPDINGGSFECGITYEVTVGGKGKSAIRGLASGAKLSGSEVEGVTFRSGIASWTFTTTTSSCV
jgi:hypothetical protein